MFRTILPPLCALLLANSVGANKGCTVCTKGAGAVVHFGTYQTYDTLVQWVAGYIGQCATGGQIALENCNSEWCLANECKTWTCDVKAWRYCRDKDLFDKTTGNEGVKVKVNGKELFADYASVSLVGARAMWIVLTTVTALHGAVQSPGGRGRQVSYRTGSFDRDQPFGAAEG
ncbi:hypothetical protein HII31_09156 [Pseudocercospora fuligena]|uniref:Uncharacterized protein n=1 Tax=Pseudocercospora fuligena TaxID=685502 RepID=A0A8H6RG93_9PEZI|nr:hypothetical protein HII31_09156 [Pseudocercospora fuligena]